MGREWPDKVKTAWIDEQEVRESGLLAHINRSVLWPLGLALAVTIEDDGSYRQGMRIFKNQPFDPIAGEASPQETEATMRKFAEWITANMEALNAAA